MVVLAVLIRLTVVGFLAITLITELFITANTKSAFAKTNKTISALVLIFPPLSSLGSNPGRRSKQNYNLHRLELVKLQAHLKA